MRYCTRDQQPLQGGIRSGMGRKWCHDPEETISTHISQNKCYRAKNFLWVKLPTWENNGSCVEDIWNNFKDIVFEGIDRFVPHKILKQNSNPEYNKEVKYLKVKVRRV
jgi:hypothetical protein